MSAIIKICVGHVVGGEPLSLPDGEYALSPVTLATTVGSVDGEEFRRLLRTAVLCKVSVQDQCNSRLIDHVNAWGAQQLHEGALVSLNNYDVACDEYRKQIATLTGRAEKAEADLLQVNEWRAAALAESQRLGELWAAKVEAADARAAKPRALLAAAGKLIKTKGRHHTELNYLALVTAYDAAAKGDAAGGAP